MRLANYNERAVLLDDATRALDVESASNGRFGPTLQQIYDHWTEFRDWQATAREEGHGEPIDPDLLGAPSPSPSQVIAVGLNYRAHAAESGFEVPTDLPPIFTKFASCLSRPNTDVRLPPQGNTDWEVELVAVIGVGGFQIAEEQAWEHVAGLCIGQDISERKSQLRGPAPQFSLGKSFPHFGPTGPWLVTPDAVPDRDDLVLGCSINGEVVQDSRTSHLIFPVAPLISQLSQTLELYPGDVIFTGTPDGVGMGREPSRFLASGDVLRSWIHGIGEITQTFK